MFTGGVMLILAFLAWSEVVAPGIRNVADLSLWLVDRAIETALATEQRR